MTDGYTAMHHAAEAAIAYRRYTATTETTPVASYAEIFAAFVSPVPETGGDPQAILAELIERATPGIRAQTSPRFFGWVIGNSHPTGVAADWLAAAWGQNAANVSAAPAASAVEAVAVRWLLDLLGLPAEASVGVVTGATVANFVCLAAARSAVLARLGWDVEADGLFGAPPIEVLIGADAHATVFSALKYLGLGAKRVRTVATDGLGRMLPSAFEAALKACAGPIIAIGQAGQICTGASDPFTEIAPVARDAGAWLHVDGAFGLWAQAAPARAAQTAGVELADSWATDGHKWLQTPYDCGFAIVRDAQAHARAMSVSASYLPPAEGPERDPSTYVPELSRRARGFAVWAMIRQLGRAGIAEMVERNCQVAAHMGETLAREPGITLVAEVPLNQFMVRFGDDDATTLAVIAKVQEDAVLYAGASQWRGQWVMRASVCSVATTMPDADVAIAAIIAAWRNVKLADLVEITGAGLSAAINPFGAELTHLRDGQGRELMTDADPAFWTGHAPLLFPIVGRLAGDVLRLDGADYPMKQHGFARRRDFALVEQGASHVRFRLEDDAETRAVYPFAFALDAAYTIAGTTLSVAITIANRGDAPMPASFGFHPAFAWPLPYGAPRADHRIVFAADEPGTLVALEDGLTVTGERPSPLDGRVLHLSDAVFAEDALIWDGLASRSVSYGAEGGPQLDVAFPDTEKLGIWSKRGAAFVCIEPWHGIADPQGFTGDFRDKPGVFEIAPGATWVCRMEITLR